MTSLKSLTAAMKQQISQRPVTVRLASLAEDRGESLVESFSPVDLSPASSDGALDALRNALKGAASLEFATIPIYLAALWSVIDQSDPVARSLRAIVHEEMLHLALANNFLVAIGGMPTMAAMAPVYPGRLPADVHPELHIEIAGLTEASLTVFLEIERPEIRVPIVDLDETEHPPAEDHTIGDFYRTILELAKNAPHLEFSTDRQIAGPLAPMVISGVRDVESAIELILHQGEGAVGIPIDTNSRDLAHYYRFLEIKLGRKLVWQDNLLYRGDRIQCPSTYPIAPPPAEGYGPAHPRRIRELSGEFNGCYSRILEDLDAAWADGGNPRFLQAMEKMFNLRAIAQEMYRTPGPDGRGFAPEFRYVRS